MKKLQPPTKEEEERYGLPPGVNPVINSPVKDSCNHNLFLLSEANGMTLLKCKKCNNTFAVEESIFMTFPGKKGKLTLSRI